MAFKDYSLNPSDNTTLGDGTYIGPNMLRNKVRPALQQLAADGKGVADEVDQLVGPLTVTSAAGQSVSTRILLAAIATPVANQSATLTEPGREGMFVFSTANLSAQVAADPQQGIYVAPSSDTTGASGAWVRKPDSTVVTELADHDGRIATVEGTITSGRLAYKTYSDLALNTTASAGVVAEVPTTDTGTHTDPVVGGTVNNTGVFRWSTSPAGWERLYDSEVAAAAGYAANAANSAAAATASASSITLPYDDVKLSLVNREAYLTTNVSNIAVRQADGTYTGAAGMSVTFDHTLTAAEIAAGQVYVDVLVNSGALSTATVEQRSATASVVAAVPLGTIGPRKYSVITLSGSATIVRITLGATAAVNFTSPAVGTGVPARGRSDPALIAADNYPADAINGLKNLGVIQSLTRTSGTGGTFTSNTFSLDPSSTYTAIIGLNDSVLATDTLCILFTFTNMMRVPTVTPARGSAVGATTPINKRNGRPEFMSATFPASVGGANPSQLNLAFSTIAQPSTTGVSTASATVLTLLGVWKSSAPPRDLTVPGVVADAISDAVAAAEAYADSASAAAGASALGGFIYGYDLEAAMSREVYQRDQMTKFVRLSGNDTLNSGATPALPYATIAKADANTAGGDTIGIHAGETHMLGSLTSVTNKNLLNYDGGLTPPLLDARQDLSANVWTNTSGNNWQTTFTSRDVPHNSGTIASADTTYYQVWLDDGSRLGGQLLTWQVGGADIATNEAAVAANPGSFTINTVGSTAPDPRATGNNSTSFRLVVQMPDGSDPNGKPLKVADRAQIIAIDGGNHGHLSLIGSWVKDGWYRTATNGIPAFQSVTLLDVACHGGLGPLNVTGVFKATGRATPGTQLYSRGRTQGGLLHFYTATPYLANALTIEEVNVSGATTGIYAHGSGNQGYKSLYIPKATITNCSTAVRIDGGPSPSQPFFAEGLTIDQAIIEDCDTAFGVPDETWLINGGHFYGSANPAAQINMLAELDGQGTLHLKNFRFNMLAYGFDGAIPRGRYLARRITTIGNPAPTLILESCFDDTKIDVANQIFKAILFRTFTESSRLILDLRAGTVIGDIQDQTNGTALPEQLFVGAECVFGMGGRTGAEIQAAFDAVGRTCSIDRNTYIVDRLGNILDRPGWKP